MMLFLQSWWSTTYNRPLKDPILLSYTLEELLYEFYDKAERRKVQEERLDEGTDKIEREKEQADLDWAEQEEKRELEAEKARQKNAANKPAQLKEDQPILDPTKDPANVKWMEEQIAIAKQQYGESFGEDIEQDFDE